MLSHRLAKLSSGIAWHVKDVFLLTTINLETISTMTVSIARGSDAFKATVWFELQGKGTFLPCAEAEPIVVGPICSLGAVVTPQTQGFVSSRSQPSQGGFGNKTS